MKVLWVTNILPAFLAKRMGVKTVPNLGWLDYSAEKLMENPDIELSVIFPSADYEDGKAEISYYTFPKKYMLKRNDSELARILKEKLRQIEPDAVHIYGTEYYHTVACVKACRELGILDRTVISIQGLASVYAGHYMNGIPQSVRYGFTLHDLIKRENLVRNVKKFSDRGTAETEALKLCGNVIGRTEWDKACTYRINKNRNYYFCNETLRETFYSGSWSYEKCDKHRIFISQFSHSIKGFHMFLKALPEIIEEYPDTKVRITGLSPFDIPWYRINSYYKYVKDLIVKNNLEEHITFLGRLNEEQMKNEYLNCNVFVMPSSIENSPNSLGEAMLLGVPCVASDVGGAADLLEHKKEGFIYPQDELYMLAHYVCKVFDSAGDAYQMGINAKAHASVTHNPQNNYLRLVSIYNEISK